MKKWKATLDLQDVWNGGEGDIKEIAKTIADRLESLINRRNLNHHNDSDPFYNIDVIDIEEIIDNFKDISEDTTSDPIDLKNDFNNWMDELYDWADCVNVWIATNFFFW